MSSKPSARDEISSIDTAQNGHADAYRIFRVGHGVERTETHGELIDDEVVGVILSLHDTSKTLLIFGAIPK